MTELAIHLIGKGWVRKTFRSEAVALAWLDRHAGDYDEVRWAA